MGRVEKGLQYLSWHYAIGCVLDVFKENVAAETGPHKYTACADIWCINGRLREELHHRACRFWCERTGLDATWFPLSVDAVSRMYFRIRKRTREETAAFEKEIEEAYAAAGKLKRGEE